MSPTASDALDALGGINNLKANLRTVPGWFGIPVGQIRRNGVWINLPPGEYERLNGIVKSFKSGGGSNLSPTQNILAAMAAEFSRLEGLALYSGNYSTIIGRNSMKNLTVAEATADELGVFEVAGNKALNMIQNEPQSYDSTAIVDWAKAVSYGSAILISLKNQYNILRLQPAITRSDVAYTAPFTRATMAATLASLRGIRIPPVCYSIAELFTRVIQVGGAEKLNSIDAQFFMPFVHGLTAALFNDQVDALDSLQKVGIFAGYINKPLVPVSEKWMDTMHIVPFYSDYAQAICELLPISSNSGGVVTYSQDYTGDVSFYYNQALGMSSLFSAAPFFRDTLSPAAACWVYIDAPAADKLSLLYFADRTVTAASELPDTTARFDYIFQVAEARSADMRGAFGHNDNFMQYNTILGDEASWNRRLSNFIFSRIMKSSNPVTSLSRLLPAMTPRLSKPGIKIATASQSSYGGG